LNRPMTHGDHVYTNGHTSPDLLRLDETNPSEWAQMSLATFATRRHNTAQHLLRSWMLNSDMIVVLGEPNTTVEESKRLLEERHWEEHKAFTVYAEVLHSRLNVSTQAPVAEEGKENIPDGVDEREEKEEREVIDLSYGD
jgi:hypothetical protein